MYFPFDDASWEYEPNSLVCRNLKSQDTWEKFFFTENHLHAKGWEGAWNTGDKTETMCGRQWDNERRSERRLKRRSLISKSQASKKLGSPSEISKACLAPLFHVIKEINISLRGVKQIALLFIEAGKVGLEIWTPWKQNVWRDKTELLKWNDKCTCIHPHTSLQTQFLTNLAEDHTFPRGRRRSCYRGSLAETEVPLRVGLTFSRNSVQDKNEILEYYSGFRRALGELFFLSSIQNPRGDYSFCSGFQRYF